MPWLSLEMPFQMVAHARRLGTICAAPELPTCCSPPPRRRSAPALMLTVAAFARCAATFQSYASMALIVSVAFVLRGGVLRQPATTQLKMARRLVSFRM